MRLYRCVGGPLHDKMAHYDLLDRQYMLEPGEDHVLRWVHNQKLDVRDPAERDQAA